MIVLIMMLYNVENNIMCCVFTKLRIRPRTKAFFHHIKIYCYFDYCARFSGYALDLNAKLWPMIIVSVVVFDLINYCISGNRKKNLGFKQPKYWKNEICQEQVNKALMCRISLSLNSTIYQLLLIYIYRYIDTLYTIHIRYMLFRVVDCIYQ